MKFQSPITLILIYSLFTGVGLASFAQQKKAPTGVLPELQINSTNEDENQKKALKSEILISKAENQAINSLIGAIKKSKGKPNEVDLWFRLGELYMRRAKSGRFFDLYRDGEDAIRFAPPEVREESAVASLKRAIQVYTKIEREFPQFREMDSVLFNNAFASQQIGLNKNAEALYLKVVERHPKSPLVPDAHLSLGEIKYNQQRFESALEHFKAIERYPLSRVYSYGLYKSAWTLYNLQRNDEAIDKLVQVAKFHDPRNDNNKKINHNLRSEALRDLSVFYGEKHTAEEAYGFFAKICTPEELGDQMISMAKLYLSHSRQKEMNIFLSEFIKRHPMSKARVKAHLLMVDASESARDRTNVLAQLKAARAVCEPGSKWVFENPQAFDESCQVDLPKATVEIAKKWWDLWQKNRKNNELADLTEQVFQLHLTKEITDKPDTKSRYAYAELLFQQGKLREASKEYEFVSLNSADTTIKHDASYSAIVSLQQASEKKKENEDLANLARLSQAYLDQYPQGEHSESLRFKLGFIAYEQENFTEAEKLFREFATGAKNAELKKRAEDLILDILNARKDYAGLKTYSQELLAKTTDSARQEKMKKISQESDYAEIQVLVTAGKSRDAAIRLVQFAEANPQSPLAKDSLWQALSLFYSSGFPLDGADLALKYQKNYPDDPKNLKALIDAAKSYSDAGLLLLAAQTMEKIASLSEPHRLQYIEAAAELYLLEGKIKEAQSAYKKLLNGKKENDGKVYSKILQTLKGKESSAEYLELEEKIASLGVEPFASEVRIRKVQALLDQKKWTEAFNAAKSFVARESGAADDIRARARLIQAKVLEKEFMETRTKTTVERLSTVLGIKTERLEKAQTAYLTAAQIANNPNVRLESLMGLRRIYENYVDTVGSPILKDEASLSEEDKTALKTELAKLVAPIAEKKQEIEGRLTRLAKESNATSADEVNFAETPASETIKPRLKPLPENYFAPFLPEVKDGQARTVSFSANKSISCQVPAANILSSLDDLSARLNTCLLQKNINSAESLATLMTRQHPNSYLPLYYLSLVSEQRGLLDKSLWLIENAGKRESLNPVIQFQAARLHFKLKDSSKANTLFLEAATKGLKSKETLLVSGFVSYGQGDCISALESFSGLSAQDVESLVLAPVMSECMAQKGDFDQAISFAETTAKKSKHAVALYIQAGHVHETYRFDSTKALQSYENALKSSPASDVKDWLQRKVDLLKGRAPTISSTLSSDL
jgi:tetratricopeptide (TPR) repeat protein